MDGLCGWDGCEGVAATTGQAVRCRSGWLWLGDNGTRWMLLVVHRILLDQCRRWMGGYRSRGVESLWLLRMLRRRDGGYLVSLVGGGGGGVRHGLTSCVTTLLSRLLLDEKTPVKVLHTKFS